LDVDASSAGVVCASAGNHGQGVAYACRALQVRGRVFVPGTTPRQKRERIASLGGDMVELVVIGDSYDEAAAAAEVSARESGAMLVPAFDALSTVTGQATVAVEILEQLGSPPDVVVLPVGGGGLLAGCGTWLRIHSPGTRLVGVEPAGAANMAAALAAGRPVELPEIDTFVDGAAVRRAGTVTYPLVRDSGAELLPVPEGQICTEMLDLYQVDGVIAEPAGALSSGALRRFLDEVLGPDDDIVLFEYMKRDNRETGAALTGIELGSADGLPGLLARIEASPLRIQHVAPGTTAYRFLV